MNAHFASLVLGLAQQADQVVSGQLPAGSPPGSTARDLARALIDTLGMLEEKTRNNLDADEQRLLGEALTALRFRYVSMEKK
jgi:hypothetical protein